MDQSWTNAWQTVGTQEIMVESKRHKSLILSICRAILMIMAWINAHCGCLKTGSSLAVLFFVIKVVMNFKFYSMALVLSIQASVVRIPFSIMYTPKSLTTGSPIEPLEINQECRHTHALPLLFLCLEPPHSPLSHRIQTVPFFKACL